MADHAFDLHHTAAAEGGFMDAGDRGFILVAQWQMEDEVHVGAQAEFG